MTQISFLSPYLMCFVARPFAGCLCFCLGVSMGLTVGLAIGSIVPIAEKVTVGLSR